MVGNIQVPQDVAKVISVEVRDTSDLMRKFLTDLLSEIKDLQETVEALEARVTTLESP